MRGGAFPARRALANSASSAAAASRSRDDGLQGVLDQRRDQLGRRVVRTGGTSFAAFEEEFEVRDAACAADCGWNSSRLSYTEPSSSTSSAA